MQEGHQTSVWIRSNGRDDVKVFFTSGGKIFIQLIYLVHKFKQGKTL